jgi:hypothetical protein
MDQAGDCAQDKEDRNRSEPGIGQGHIEKLDFDRREVSVGWVEDSLMEFSRFDHQSFAFRYPHDKS